MDNDRQRCDSIHRNSRKSGLHLGDFRPRLVREFLKLGGDLSKCPFGHQYDGPIIRWTDGYPWMFSSKGQKELFDEGSI